MFHHISDPLFASPFCKKTEAQNDKVKDAPGPKFDQKLSQFSLKINLNKQKPPDAPGDFEGEQNFLLEITK